MTDAKSKVVIDHLIVVCQGCRREQTFYPDVPIVGTEALIAWMKTIASCGCGAKKCDVKAHMMEKAEREGP